VELKNVLSTIDTNTEKYINMVDLTVRKKNSQYFTPFSIGSYMSDKINLDKNMKVVRVLEPSGGTGRLAAAFLLGLDFSSVDKVYIDIFELDKNLIDILETNIKLISNYFSEKNVELDYSIYCENFLEYDNSNKYDVIIGNPPYKKIRKNSSEAIANSELLHGQPNLYGLFIGKGVRMLNDEGQLIYLVPRSFFNGKYFSRVRELILNDYSLSFIHSFESRTKVINNEILQELVIVKIEKKMIGEVIIKHSLGIEDIDMSSEFVVEKDIIWDVENIKIRLPIKNNHIDIIRKMNSFRFNLSDYNLRFKTGPLVDFRMSEYIDIVQSFNKYYPIYWCANFGDTNVKWPLVDTKYPQYVSNDIPISVLLNKGNYLLVKRFSSKEESKCLKVNKICFNSYMYDKFTVENHVNYLKVNDEDIILLLGLFVLYNSKFYSDYFSIINGTTQINVTDLNQLPVPNISTIRILGEKANRIDYSNPEECEKLLFSCI
jgi:adenine-specific DNA-methyltransferase